MKKNGWILFLFVLLGMLAGALVAKWLQDVPGLSFLTRATIVNWSPSADLSVISYSLSLNINFTLLSVVGIIAAVLLYRKM